MKNPRLAVLLVFPLLSTTLLSGGLVVSDALSTIAAFNAKVGKYDTVGSSLVRGTSSHCSTGMVCKISSNRKMLGNTWYAFLGGSRRSKIWQSSSSVGSSTSFSSDSNGNTFMGVRSIGVDYGTVRTGVAVSRGLTPRPLVILKDLKNTTEVALEIARICEAERAQQLVLGLPLDKNGTETKQAEITRQFAATLATICLEYMGPNFALWFWDERYTSKFALARLQTSTNRDAADLSRAWIDADSACIILEDFYNLNGHGAERIHVPSPDVRVECLRKWEERQARRQAALDWHNQQREISVNARSEAIRRVKELEARMAKDGLKLSSSKAKAKKRRKKSSGWITL